MADNETFSGVHDTNKHTDKRMYYWVENINLVKNIIFRFQSKDNNKVVLVSRIKAKKMINSEDPLISILNHLF